MREHSPDLKCFVIAPIGAQGSHERKKSDAVMRLITDAAAEAGKGRRRQLVPYRGDESRLNGDILRDIVTSILEDELIVGVLFSGGFGAHNANVYFELGIAQTLGRPVILLKEEGYSAPFDIMMLRSLTYSPAIYEGGEDHETQARLAADLHEFLDDVARAPVCQVPFDIERLAPPARTLALDRFNFLKYEAWSQLILNAEKEIWLAGTSLWELLNPEKDAFCDAGEGGESLDTPQRCTLLDLLRVMYARGRTINVLTMHEDSPCLPRMMKAADEARRSNMLRRARGEILDSHAELAKVLDALDDPQPDGLRRRGGVFRVVKVRERPLTHRVTMTEKIGYVTPIFYARATPNTGPSFRVTPKSKFETRRLGKNEFAGICLYDEVLEDLKLHVRENEVIEKRADA